MYLIEGPFFYWGSGYNRPLYYNTVTFFTLNDDFSLIYGLDGLRSKC